MNTDTVRAGFIGAGGIARPHVFSLNSIKYYYNDAPRVDLVAVASASPKSRESFASLYGFRAAVSPGDFFRNEEIDTVYILGPNNVHSEHLERAVSMPSVRRVYIEKPICAAWEEEKLIKRLARQHPGIRMQTGFQYLYMTAVREALTFWKSGVTGRPVHFELKYFHGDYLHKSYRDKRANRLVPAPSGGALADLGSHAISMLIAFLGNDLSVVAASASGSFEDVDPRSDLFSVVMLRHEGSGAAGTVSASRIASGSGDTLSMDLYCEKGSIRFTSEKPDHFEYYLEETGRWTRVPCGSRYDGITSFPSGHVPPGWLRPMIHAHYVFLTGNDDATAFPGVDHALEVQRILREAAERFNI